MAGRTQESTQKIQEMIEHLQTGASKAVSAIEAGQQQAQRSVEQVNKAGESLTKITQSVGIITDMNHQIASAAEEQHSVSNEIDRNVLNISQVSKETAEGARQSAESSNEMAHMVSQLHDLVAQFEV